MSKIKKMISEDYKFISVLLLTFFIGIGLTSIDTSDGIANQVAKVRTAVVHIEKVGQWQGSGFIVSEDGLIVTARHVVEGGGLFRVTLDDGTQYTTTMAVSSSTYDVGFLKINVEDPLPVVKMVDTEFRPGDTVFIMGSPLGKDNFNSVTMGIISSDFRNFDNGQTVGWGWPVLFQSDSASFPGNSGGPVFNKNGNVIGVLVGGMSPSLNYSVPVKVFMHQLSLVKHLLMEKEFEVVELQAIALPTDDYTYHSWE